MKIFLASAASALAVALIGFVYYTLVLAPQIALFACASGPMDHCIHIIVVGGVIKVDNPKLYKHGPGHRVRWIIDNAPGQAYKFPSPPPPDGIAFGSTGSSVFRCTRIDDINFRCVDPDGPVGEYKYTISLSGSPAVTPLDPWVVND
jgi:hypothetical protein